MIKYNVYKSAELIKSRLHDAAADERDALRVKVSDLERAAVKRREISDGVEAELVDECDTLRTLEIRAGAERDELRAKYDELLVALHGIGAALGIPEGDRSPYSVTCGVLERVNRLAEIEAQEPVAISKAGNLFWAGNPQDWRGVDCSLFARPVPAQAVPDGWRLVPVDPTQEMLDAAVTDFERERHAVPLVMEARRASWSRMIAAAPEHKA